MNETTAEDIRANPARRWSMLGLGVLAQAAGAVFSNAPAFLLPTLQNAHGMELSHAGLVVAAPTVGFLVSLMAWGTVVDRIGEPGPLTDWGSLRRRDASDPGDGGLACSGGRRRLPGARSSREHRPVVIPVRV